MLNLVSQQIILCVSPVDFRKGIDGLVAIASNVLKLDPRSGVCFVFTNRSHSDLKILYYDKQGFWLCHKRFSKGRLSYWPTMQDPKLSLNLSELMVLIYGGDWRSAKFIENFERIA